MFYNKNEISFSSDEENKNKEELSIFNSTKNKHSSFQKDNKSTNNQDINAINHQRKMSEIQTNSFKPNNALSSVVNPNINIGYDKFNKAQRILDNQKERMHSINLKNNINLNLLQNNIPISRPSADMVKTGGVNNILIKNNIKESNNICINLTESSKKEHNNQSQTENNVVLKKKQSQDITFPSSTLNKQNSNNYDDDEVNNENNENRMEENKVEIINTNNSNLVNENDPKYSLYYHVITSPIKPIGFDDLKIFLTSVVPEGKTLQCNILRKKTGLERLYPKYYVSINNNEKFLMAARKRPNNTTPNYIITMDNEVFDKTSHLFLGKLRSNFMGTEFQIYDTGKNPNDTKNYDDVRAHLGCIKYKTNFFGMNGPRKMKVYIPNLDKFGNTIVYKPLNKNESIVNKYKNGDKENIKIYVNKQPKWSEKHQAFVLNFNGRVDRGSVKNFQLVDSEDDEKVILQFGRLNDNLFSMDFTSPLTPFQAFAICLSSLDSKFACE